MAHRLKIHPPFTRFILTCGVYFFVTCGADKVTAQTRCEQAVEEAVWQTLVQGLHRENTPVWWRRWVRTSQSRWETYYQNTQGDPPHHTVREAHRLFGENAGELKALDLGAGAGNDTKFLLNHGWKVLSVDPDPASIQRLQKFIDQNKLHHRAAAQKARAEDFNSPVLFDLINASQTTYFFEPSTYGQTFAHLLSFIKTGGRFSGHILGHRDTWVETEGKTGWSREDILQFFKDHGFEVETIAEREGHGPTVGGGSKHWHVFSVVARRVQP